MTGLHEGRKEGRKKKRKGERKKERNARKDTFSPYLFYISPDHRRPSGSELSVYLFVYLPVYFCVYLSVHLSIYLRIHLTPLSIPPKKNKTPACFPFPLPLPSFDTLIPYLPPLSLTHPFSPHILAPISGQQVGYRGVTRQVGR